MSKPSNFITNVFFSGLSWLSSLAFLVILILAARFLGDEVYGQFSFAFSLVALFEVTADLGMKAYVVREIARSRDRTGEFLTHALALKTGLAALTTLILIGLALFMDVTGEVRTAIYLLTIAMISKSYKLMLKSLESRKICHVVHTLEKGLP